MIEQRTADTYNKEEVEHKNGYVRKSNEVILRIARFSQTFWKLGEAHTSED